MEEREDKREVMSEGKAISCMSERGNLPLLLYISYPHLDFVVVM